ncbi:hypothetical protein SAMN04488134_101603 [Amphibacillus marinus]|uniref:Uncharacterized protein n=1 Tax=Amphibacillus marinus TaxID=872970 RepID=A0A1H8IFY9_9BACI|nr:DUF5392 family protein [Amphibacillus marinus]SEN67126.1 hypothetical protein SAMN04488134_101603 [Amphibacillus marinus]
MNSAQFEQLPPFIKREMDLISEKIRPIMKKVSTYYMFGFPLMLIGILNMVLPFINTDFAMETLLIPAIFALVAAIGIALFKESRFLRKQIHRIGKDYMVERISKSEVMEDSEKSRYITNVKKQVRMDLQPFFKFLTEENKRRQLR